MRYRTAKRAKFDRDNAEWRRAFIEEAPHSRERLFLVAYSDKVGRWSWGSGMSDAPRCDHWKAAQDKRKWSDMERWLGETFQDCDGATAHAATVGMVDGIPREVECGMFGNSVSPIVAEWIGRRIVESCGVVE